MTARTVTSLLDGSAGGDAPGGTLEIANPARLEETVVEARLGDAATFLDACRRAKTAQPTWATVRSGPRQSDPATRPARGRQRRVPFPPHHP